MNKPNKISRLEINLYAFFLVTSPMYWFFGVPVFVFGIVKYSLVLGVFYLALKNSKHVNSIKLSEIITITILISLILIPAIFGIGESQVFIISNIYPFVYALVLMFTFRVFIVRDFDDTSIRSVINKINFIIILLTSVIIASYYLDLGLTAPAEFNNFPVTFSGFGSLRTGWSGGLAMFVGANLYFCLTGTIKESNLVRLSIFMLILTQYLSGGRGGLITSLLLVLFYLMYHKRHIEIAIIIISFAVFSIFNMELILTQLRISSEYSGSAAGISSGRLEQYFEVGNLLLNNTFLPFGAYGYMDYFESIGIFNTIHNVWLRSAVEYTILFPIVLLLFISISVFNSNIKNSAKIVVLLTLSPTLFEPSAIIFNINNYLLWWFIFSYSTSR